MDDFLKIAISAGIGGALSGFSVMIAMRIQMATIQNDILWIKEHLRELK